jgi:hypothetical protein
MAAYSGLVFKIFNQTMVQNNTVKSSQKSDLAWQIWGITSRSLFYNKTSLKIQPKKLPDLARQIWVITIGACFTTKTSLIGHIWRTYSY